MNSPDLQALPVDPPPSAPRLRRILPPGAGSTGSWPLYGRDDSRAVEAAAHPALPPHTLMRRAGEASARLALAMAPHARRVWVAAGPGNNGGDGLEAALRLTQAGKSVSVSLLADPDRLPADAAAALQRARAAGVVVTPGDPAALPSAAPADLAIDALLGLGSSSRRRPEGLLASAVAQLRAWPGPVLALDLPTGLDAETGQPVGGDIATCVRATHTLALLTLKPGLFTGHGRDLAGTVWFDDLGVTPRLDPLAELSGEAAALALLPPRAHAQHKGSFGDVLVVGGAPSMTGAALLAARAALAAGAGRVYTALLDPAALRHDALAPELMFREPGAFERMDATSLTVVCGCGGGDAVAAVLPGVLERAARVVLDADALNQVAADTQLAHLLRARSAQGLATILTPHPLEAARLLGCTTQEVQADRLQAAVRLAERLTCTVVLKGSGSVVAAPGRRPAVNGSGNAALASAGTGDVLAGWLGGRWAQGLEARDAAVLAVYEHGAAADRWLALGRDTRGPLSASALIGVLGRAVG
ncbi:NAD(P)H-hydrate dehydratase [Caldimonas brevitalea]|uniref:Bifunctional NAD(P)H-hydrate repair enzyme n=1 Tax=Caldimonas brevitalea TaxID=413882 RepID=A0A0G3BR12_9BURK|nr:NAD(P)H-hydrate dehydratase [Caldimonas brevitalea]AKJ28995.1 carbohydrate kinase [Caldimonas brevitalea]